MSLLHASDCFFTLHRPGPWEMADVALLYKGPRITERNHSCCVRRSCFCARHFAYIISLNYNTLMHFESSLVLLQTKHIDPQRISILQKMKQMKISKQGKCLLPLAWHQRQRLDHKIWEIPVCILEWELRFHLRGLMVRSRVKTPPPTTYPWSDVVVKAGDK